MPRKPRIVVPGAVHHIMSRGIEGRPIFRNDADRRFFMRLLQQGIERSRFLLYAWTLMDNHYHLALRLNEFSLARFMRALNGPYAQHFRKSASLRGNLFQDRYKSIATQDQNYVQEVIRYVHLNPLRSGTCKSLKELKYYQWCGHSVLMGTQAFAPQNTADVLRRFGKTTSAARRNYEHFLNEGISSEHPVLDQLRLSNSEAESVNSTSCWVIGNRDFVRKSLSETERARSRIAAHAAEGVSLEQLAGRICGALDVPPEYLRTRGRENARSRARQIFAYAAHREYQFSVGAIARFLGVSSPAVSAMHGKGERLAKEITY